MGWCIVMIQAFNSANQQWIVNYTMENFEFSSEETGLIILVFFLLIAVVAAVASACVKPGLIPCLIGSLSLPVGTLLIVGAGTSRVVYFLGWATWLIAAAAGPCMTVLLMAQQPPSNRHQLIGALKQFQAIFSFVATLISGYFTSEWLDEKEKGSHNARPPCWSTLPWALFAVFFICCSFCFRDQDKKLYGANENSQEGTAG